LPFLERLVPYDAALTNLGVDLSQRRGLGRYLDRLWRHNQEINLVSRKMTAEALVTDHLLDSLLGLPHLGTATRIVDLGSGGGFPAIALAICAPNRHFTLIEKSPLKRRFLQSLTDLCANIHISGRLEADDLPEDIDLIIARAFKPLHVILTLTKAYHARGGHYLLYRARRQKIEAELRQAKVGAHRIIELQPFGDAEERHLLLLP
jgi:16S rRNA (guanine527-N7)-methyltransferase